jgi:hypothetical protein
MNKLDERRLVDMLHHAELAISLPAIARRLGCKRMSGPS